MLRACLLLAFLAALATVPAALATIEPIHRCRTADGIPTFSDRPCRALGARADLPGRPGRAGQRLFVSTAPFGCPGRTPQALLGALRSAIDSGDANHVAGLYDWRGVSQRGAGPLLRRLQHIARRPSVEIALESPQAGAFDYIDGVMVPVAAPPPDAGSRVRVDQYQYPDGGPIVSEYFSLSGKRGCYWLAF